MEEKRRKRPLQQRNEIWVPTQVTKPGLQPWEWKVTKVLILVTSSTHVSKENDKRRSELFHIRVVSKNTNIETLFDLGSQVNLISESVVKKLGIQTKESPQALSSWMCM